MELLFIWIKGLNEKSNLGLNFSNRFRFTYDAKKNILAVKSAENYVENFFGKNISNFTSIIGANGAGKTSILRFILQHCSDGTSNNFPKESLIVFKNSKQYFYCGPTRLTIQSETEINQIERVNEIKDFKNATNIVYLSNQFDPTSFYSYDYTRMQLGHTRNLSTWFLLDSDIQTRTGEDFSRRSIPFYNKIEAFAALEFMRMVKVLRWINRSSERNPFPVTMPPYLNLRFNDFQDHPNSNIFNSLSQRLDQYFKAGNNSRNSFLLKAFESMIFHFLDESRFSSGPKEVSIEYERTFDKLLDFLSKNEYQNNPENSIIYELNSILRRLAVRPSTFEVFKQRFDVIQEFLNKLDQFVHSRRVIVDRGHTTLSIALTEANMGILEELIDSYFKVEKIGESAVFYFSHQPHRTSSLSSGEYTLLSFFGRLNELRFNRGASILLLIDEAELTLHPEWQKQFVSLFIDFIAEKFNYAKVQIVLTSHSPFILSDQPPHCVTLLKKISDETIVIDSLDKKNETFGANIHELFTDSFFLEDSLIGEFARRKINELIETVNGKQRFNQEDYDRLKKQIDIIGEPFVRFKLLEKVISGMPPEIFDNVVLEREKELDLIKKLRRDKNRD